MKDYSNFWDNVDKIPLYDVGHILRRREIAKYVPKDAKRLLSIGSGFGEELLGIQHQNPKLKIYCLDLSPGALEKCKKILGLAIGLRLGDAQNLPYTDNYFDVVTIFEVLEHVPNDQKAVREIKRVLKQKGLVIVSVPSAGVKLTPKWQRHGHLRHYRDQDIRKLLESNNFSYLTDINYYERTRLLYRPVKKLFQAYNLMANKILRQTKEYVDRWLYKNVLTPFFLYLAKFEVGMKPKRLYEKKYIAVYKKIA